MGGQTVVPLGRSCALELSFRQDVNYQKWGGQRHHEKPYHVRSRLRRRTMDQKKVTQMVEVLNGLTPTSAIVYFFPH
jgi:hypothetical protein